MNKLILICLLFVIPTAFAVTCNNDALATALDFTPLDNSETASGLGFCTALNTQQICCSAATINSVQAFVDAQMVETIAYAAARDTYLLTVSTALTAIKSTFATLQTNAVAAKAAVNGIPAPEEGSAPASYAAFVALLARANARPLSIDLTTASTDLNAILTSVDTNWDAYQEARADCANVLLETQASVYCLACRPEPTTYSSFTTGTLNYDTTYEGTIAAACKPYLDYATQFNLMTRFYLLTSKLSDINTLLTSVTTTPTNANDAAVTSLTGYLAVTAPTADAQEIPTVTSCATTSLCVDAYTVILEDGIALNPAYLGNGGTITVASSSRRVLAGENRALQAGAAYDPSTTANTAGVTVEFPADVIAAAANAWRQGGLMTCVVALVAMLLF